MVCVVEAFAVTPAARPVAMIALAKLAAAPATPVAVATTTAPAVGNLPDAIRPITTSAFAVAAISAATPAVAAIAVAEIGIVSAVCIITADFTATAITARRITTPVCAAAKIIIYLVVGVAVAIAATRFAPVARP
jgi:hypothetical protein